MSGASPIDPEILLAEAGWVRRLARRLVDDDGEAEDLVQETWRVALERPPVQRASRPVLRAWLSRVVHNMGHRMRRDTHARRWHERAASREEAVDDSVETTARVELVRRVAQAILSLDEPYRSAIRLRYIDGLSAREAAQRQGISNEALRQRLSRGIGMLRARLDHEYGERSAWGLVCIAMTGGGKPVAGATTAVSGGLMSMNVKLVAGIAALVAIAGILTWSAIERNRIGVVDDVVASRRLDARLDVRSLPESSASSVDERARVALTPDENATASKQVIDRERDLHGVVLAPNGSPLPGAHIALFRAEHEVMSLAGPAPRSLRKKIAETDTNERGEFVVPLERGYGHDLEVRAPGCSMEFASDCNAGEHMVVRMHRASALVGRVIRHPDGAPLENAQVHVKIYPGSASFLAEARTDADGRYRVDEVPLKDLGVWARVPGKTIESFARVSPVEGSEIEHDFSLRLGATLHGTVVDSADAHPIENAEINSGALWNGDTVRSDVSGEFTLTGLHTPATGASAFPKLFARAEGYALACIPTGKPDGTAFASNFTIRLSREVRVEGRVVDDTGVPLEGAWLRAAFPNRTEYGVVAATDSSGRFAMKNLGEYAHGLLVTKAGYGDRVFPLMFHRDIDPRTTMTDIGDIRLERAASLSGTLVDDAGQAIPSFELRLTGGPAMTPPASVSTWPCRTDDLGRFCVTDLSPGDYTLSARWPASSTPVTVRATLANHEDRRGIDIVLPRGLEIAGIVRGADGRPLSQVQVRLTGEAQSNEAHLWFYAMTDASGRFGSQGMPPGTFRLACFPEQENVDANGSSRASPKVMSGIEAGRHDVDVQVAPGSWMRCVVLDASGMSAPSAQVIVYDGDAELVRLRTDGNGHCGMILDRTHTWNLVATPSIIRSRALDPTAAPEAAYSTRADGIAPGGPEIELRLPAQ